MSYLQRHDVAVYFQVISRCCTLNQFSFIYQKTGGLMCYGMLFSGRKTLSAYLHECKYGTLPDTYMNVSTVHYLIIQ